MKKNIYLLGFFLLFIFGCQQKEVIKTHGVAYLKKRDNNFYKNDDVVICLSGRGDKDVHTVADFLKKRSD